VVAGRVPLDALTADDDAGATVGRVYAANTFGAIAGAVLTPLLFVPFVGTHGAQRLLIVAAAVSAGVGMRPLSRATRDASGTEARTGLRVRRHGGAGVFAGRRRDGRSNRFARAGGTGGLGTPAPVVRRAECGVRGRGSPRFDRRDGGIERMAEFPCERKG